MEVVSPVSDGPAQIAATTIRNPKHEEGKTLQQGVALSHRSKRARIKSLDDGMRQRDGDGVATVEMEAWLAALPPPAPGPPHPPFVFSRSFTPLCGCFQRHLTSPIYLGLMVGLQLVGSAVFALLIIAFYVVLGPSHLRSSRGGCVPTPSSGPDVRGWRVRTPPRLRALMARLGRPR